MNNSNSRANTLSARTTLRARCTSPVRFQLDRQSGGHAEMIDVGLGGLQLATSLEVAVGNHILMEVNNPQGGGCAELKGKVVWQRETTNGFRIGVRVFEDDDTARLVLGDWLHAALKAQSGLEHLHGRQRVLVDLALASKNVEEQHSVWQRLRPTRPMTGVTIATATF